MVRVMVVPAMSNTRPQVGQLAVPESLQPVITAETNAPTAGAFLYPANETVETIEPFTPGLSGQRRNRRQHKGAAPADDTNADSLDRYLHTISQTPLLKTAKNEAALAKRIEAGTYASTLLDYNVLSSETRAQAYTRLRATGLTASRAFAEAKQAGTQQNFLDAIRAAVRARKADQAEADHQATLFHERAASLIKADARWLVADGERARDHFIRANLLLVVKIARPYIRPYRPLDDLIQAGSLGLLRAVDKFDYEKDYKFSTYATWWIRQAVGRFCADQDRSVRLPIGLVDEIRELRKAESDLAQMRAEMPSDEAVVALINERRFARSSKKPMVTVQGIAALRRYDREVLSLDEVVSDDGAAERVDLTADPRATDPAAVAESSQLQQDLLTALHEALQPVKNPHVAAFVGRRLLSMYRGEALSPLKSQAQAAGLSMGAVSFTMQKVFERLRANPILAEHAHHT